MSTKKKILQYLEFKDISQGKFCRKIGVSNGFLGSGKHIGSEKLKIIRDNYIDLNMNWLIYDEGEMIIKENVFINDYEVVYDKFAKDKVTISKKITDALKSNNLNDTFELLINEYVILQKKHNITQRALTGSTLVFNKLREIVNSLTHTS